MPSIQPSYPHVAFIGLGAMGFAMSTHLVRTGFPVTAYDIYQPTLERWRSECKKIPYSQAMVSNSSSQAVEYATVVCLMVANHHHVHSVLFDKETGAIGALPQNCTVIIHATIPLEQPSTVHSRLVTEFKRPDITLIDAPVSGGVARSINGTLVIMASSGNSLAFQTAAAKTTLESLASKGKSLYIIPGPLGGGQAAKALNQVMCGINIVSASEIMGLAAIQGLDTREFYNKLIAKDSNGNQAPGWSWMLEDRGPRILSTDPLIASAITIINKDVCIIQDEEKRLGIKLPLLNAAGEVIAATMKTSAFADDSFIAQHYFHKNFERRNPIVEAAGNPATVAHEQESMTSGVVNAHVAIHLVSAYETIKFAHALKLMGNEERKLWYSIISSAAGGSTIFTEVIPRAFEDAENIERAFKMYTLERFPNILETTTSIIKQAKAKGYTPKLLEIALENLAILLTQ